MTKHILVCLILLQCSCSLVTAWCLYFCPHNDQAETVCAVDVERGAKLFHGKCQVWKENYCLTAAYQELDMQLCMDRHPEAVDTYLTAHRGVQKYLRSGAYWGVRPFRRFIWMYSLINNLAPRPPLAPLLLWALLQPPRTAPNTKVEIEVNNVLFNQINK